MVNHASGLLGVSEMSPDMHDLLSFEATDERAAEAIALFCPDTLVFAGGIGENAPLIRARICAGLGFLGIELDLTPNTQSATVISSAASRVQVRVARAAMPFCAHAE